MRKYAIGAVTVLILVIALIIGRGRGSDRKPLLLSTWSNYFSDEILAEFTARTGVPVQVSYITSNEELLSKMKAGADDYDLIMPSDYMVKQMATLGMLSQLDPKLLPNSIHLDPYFRSLPYDPGLTVSIPFVQGTTGIAVNTEFVEIHEPVGWALLFDSPAPGRTSMLEDIREVFAAGLLYNGKDSNERSPEALRLAAKSLADSKTRVSMYTSEPLPKLLQGEVHIAHTYSTHGVLAHLENPKIKYYIPKEGASIWTDNFAVPMSSPRKHEAHQFIDFCLEPEVSVRIITYNKLASPNLTARRNLPQEELRPEVYPSDDVMKRLYFMQDLGESLTLVNRLWTELRT